MLSLAVKLKLPQPRLFTLLVSIQKMLFKRCVEDQFQTSAIFLQTLLYQLPSLNQRCRRKSFSSNQPNVRIITHTNYGSLTYLNDNFHAVTSTLVKPNYAIGRFTVATLQWIKATILNAPISKTDVLNSHSDIFKTIAVLNS